MHRIQSKIIELLRKRGGVLRDFSFRRLGEMAGIDHPQQIKHHLKQLEKRGLVNVDSASRVLHLANLGATQGSELVTVRVIGAANCGPATLFAEESIEGTLKISRRLILNRDKKIFAIRAVGNSMNRANINGRSVEDGDYVIIDGGAFTPRDGDYVLAVIDDFGVVKKFKRLKSDIELVSESTEEHPSIHIHPNDQPFVVNGKVIFVVKKPKMKWSD